MKFAIRLADRVISVTCQHEYTLKACKEYIVDAGEPAFAVCATDDEVRLEMQSASEPIDAAYAEFICLYRKIAEELPRYHCIVTHGAAISYKGAAILFTAPSGTGKSTHIKLWKKTFKDQVDIINGDEPILRIEDTASVFGTPWAGKENWHKNRQAPLYAICLLKQAKNNRINKVDPQTCLPALLKQVYLPTDATSMKQTLKLFDALLKSIPVYVLECNISREAVMTAYNAVAEEHLHEN